ncbi:hypothetical protein [Prevotella nigrescens]
MCKNRRSTRNKSEVPPPRKKQLNESILRERFPPSNIAATSLPEHCGGKKSKGLKKEEEL